MATVFSFGKYTALIPLLKNNWRLAHIFSLQNFAQTLMGDIAQLEDRRCFSSFPINFWYNLAGLARVDKGFVESDSQRGIGDVKGNRAFAVSGGGDGGFAPGDPL